MFCSGAASDDDSQFSSGRRVHMDSDRRLVVNARYIHFGHGDRFVWTRRCTFSKS